MAFQIILEKLSPEQLQEMGLTRIDEQSDWLGLDQPDSLENMSKREIKLLAKYDPESLMKLYNAQCKDKKSTKCTEAYNMYRYLNPTGSL